MMEDIKYNNSLIISGIAKTKPEYTHTVTKKITNTPIDYYEFVIASKRTSGFYDEAVISIPSFLMKDIDFDKPLFVEGELRTCNIESHLKVYVFAQTLRQMDENEEHQDILYATTYVCKPPSYRTTPFGRVITDLTLACIRNYRSRSDYFPSITWGSTAKLAKSLNVGDKLYITARLQSRTYQKKLDENIVEDRIAYEVSVNHFEKMAN